MIQHKFENRELSTTSFQGAKTKGSTAFSSAHGNNRLLQCQGKNLLTRATGDSRLRGKKVGCSDRAFRNRNDGRNWPGVELSVQLCSTCLLNVDRSAIWNQYLFCRLLRTLCWRICQHVTCYKTMLRFAIHIFRAFFGLIFTSSF